jgi:HD-GYP domain-containing protein (c-di-GMP phosphodiesterase class II)
MMRFVRQDGWEGKMQATTEKPSCTNCATCACAAASLPVGSLDQLAARIRSSGLLLACVRCDGVLSYHDRCADPFFRKYVLPLLGRRDFLAQLRCSDSKITLIDWIPGIALAAFPLVDRRQVSGIIVLAGKAHEFSLNEDVLRCCSQLGIDATWLQQQGRTLASFTPEAIESQASLLQGMANDQFRLAGLESELTSLSTQLSNTYEELSLVYQLSSGMRVNRTPREFIQRACTEVIDVIHVRGLGVAVELDNSPLDQSALYGTLSLPEALVRKLGTQLINILRLRPTPLLINDVSADSAFGWLAPYTPNLMAVPLQRQEQVFGCIFALDKSSDEFDTVDAKLLNSIANESSIYLENSILYEDVRELLMGLLHSLVNAVDAKDAYTCGHSERVALLSRMIAQQARLSEQLVERIYMAGLLHDVGKIGVPEAVLQKAGKLTPEEFEQIKKHPEMGARILQDIKQLRDIIPGVLYHHERYDGRGYPTGLAGEDIPLMGRVICLADCFDAMTSSRTYRKAMPLEVALTEIRRCAGTQFDPHLADVFLSITSDVMREMLMDHKRQTKHLIQRQQSLRAA